MALLFSRRHRRKAEARKRLASAYKAVFSSNATPDDVEIVLADMANFSGYFNVAGEGAILRGSIDLRYREGKRLVFSRVLRFLELPEHEVAALQAAARIEAQADAEEKEI